MREAARSQTLHPERMTDWGIHLASVNFNGSANPTPSTHPCEIGTEWLFASRLAPLPIAAPLRYRFMSIFELTATVLSKDPEYASKINIGAAIER